MTHDQLLIHLRKVAQQRAAEQGISYTKYLQDLAKKMGMYDTGIFRMLKGEHSPSIERFCLLANLIDLEVKLTHKNKKP